jgi:GNAT superfamily N-acetyltransferase
MAIIFKLLDTENLHSTKDFSCGNLDIDLYLKGNAIFDHYEVKDATTLVFNDSMLVAYFTLKVGTSIPVINPDTQEITNFETLELVYLGVDSRFQSLGYGTAVINEIKRLAKSTQHRMILLQAVKDATIFYQKNGFEIIEEDQLSSAMIYDTVNPAELEKLWSI